MLSFFRINDPYRLLVLFVILIGFRLPIMWSDASLTMPELNYMLDGEKLNSGATLYEGLWDNIAPFSALTYAIIDFLFGRSQLAYQLVAFIFLSLQCYFFNRLLLRNKAYNESTYIPGLIYGILMSYFFDFFTLTPLLMGLTFVLLALENIFSHIEFRAKRDEKILNIGLYLGIASLFYLPFVVFGLAAILLFVFFTSTVMRRYLLMIFGFFLPIMMVGSYFLYNGRLDVFLYNFINTIFKYKAQKYYDGISLMVIFSTPILLFILALVKISSRGRFTNYQARISQAMFVWLIFSIIFLFVCDIIAPATFGVFVPMVAFYMSHYFLLFRRRWIGEVIFTLLSASLILFNYGVYFKFFPAHQYINENRYLIEQTNLESKWNNKKILVLDEDLTPYLYNTPATPFLNWQLSEPLFKHPDYYDNLTIIFNGFKEDMPEIILDKYNVMPSVFGKIPQLKVKYRRQGEGVYTLI